VNVVILCARMASTRLPGKALAALGGKTVLHHLVDRYRTCRRVERVIVATTRDESDDPIARLCGVIGVPCYRGSINNVVGRMNDALMHHAPAATAVFRGLGDMPLFDTGLLDWRFELLARRKADVIWCGLPDDPFPVYGSRESPWSRSAWDQIVRFSKADELEHAGQCLYRNLARYRVVYTEMLPEEYYRPYRFELDTPDDLALFREIFNALHTGPGTPSTLDALRWLDAHPEAAALNAGVEIKTLTVVDWEKRRGSLWRCSECGAHPLQADTVRAVRGSDGRTRRKLVTVCPGCGVERDFYEAVER
jgi:spore coat polysaccharide biosynthesis protein SpsF